jgi:hypothetical protein
MPNLVPDLVGAIGRDLRRVSLLDRLVGLGRKDEAVVVRGHRLTRLLPRAERRTRHTSRQPRSQILAESTRPPPNGLERARRIGADQYTTNVTQRLYLLRRFAAVDRDTSGWDTRHLVLSPRRFVCLVCVALASLAVAAIPAHAVRAEHTSTHCAAVTTSSAEYSHISVVGVTCAYARHSLKTRGGAPWPCISNKGLNGWTMYTCTHGNKEIVYQTHSAAG